MDWQSEHQNRISQFPKPIQQAHLHSANHRLEIESSAVCGCFYCCTLFKPSEIHEWVDENENDIGQTALSPNCGIDSVIGAKSGFPIHTDFLNEMNSFWF